MSCGNVVGRRRFRRCRVGRPGCSSKSTGDDLADTVARAETLGNDCGALESLVVTDSGQSAALWRIRADGAGLSSRSPAGLPAHAGWEDAAVPPAMLGDYLRDFDALMTEYGFTGLPYGHFGDGCLHIRIDFPLRQTRWRQGVSRVSGGRGRIGRRLRRLTVGGARRRPGPRRTAADDVLRRRHSKLFGAVKNVFDPQNILNPGVIVDPRPLDADLREPAPVLAPRTWRWPTTATAEISRRRCTAAPGSVSAAPTTPATGGVMCPSYLATREEKDSTRGRARVLAGDGQRLGRHRRLAIPGGARGARPVPVVQGLPVGLPDRYRHGVLQGRGAPSELPGPGPSRVALHAGPAAALGGAGGPDAARGELRCGLPRNRSGGNVAGRGGLPVAAFRRSPARRFGPGSRSEHRDVAGDPVLLFVDSFTNYFTPGGRQSRRCACCRPPVTHRG